VTRRHTEPFRAFSASPPVAPRSKIHDHAPLAAIGHERGPMILDLRWLAVAVGRWVASCAKAVGSMLGVIAKPRPKRPENPDPGNRRLRALAADPIFARLPPGAVRTRWREYPAKFPIFFFAGGDRWSEPCVILKFTSAQSVLNVHRFYAERALETGWQTRPRDLPRNWSKHIAGRQASITLFNDFDRSVNMTESRTPRSYLLRASFSGPQLWSAFFLPAERGDDRVPDGGCDLRCCAEAERNPLASSLKVTSRRTDVVQGLPRPSAGGRR